MNLCPVRAFTALRDHPRAKSLKSPKSLFVHSIRPDQPVLVTTISSWIRRLIRLSTTESKVSLRSVAATLALENNVPLQDIVTLGNWFSSTTFEQHYRCLTMLRTNFTSVVLSPDPLPSHDEDTDEDIFADAPSDFPSDS